MYIVPSYSINQLAWINTSDHRRKAVYFTFRKKQRYSDSCFGKILPSSWDESHNNPPTKQWTMQGYKCKWYGKHAKWLEWGGITVVGWGAEVEPGETSAKPDTGVQPVCSGCSYQMLNNEMFLCQMVTVFSHTHSRVSSDLAISVPPPGIPNTHTHTHTHTHTPS